MKRLALVLAFSLFCASGYAVQEFYSLTRSIRALGMGGAFYGLSDDQYALFYNPAGLDLYRRDPEWMITVPVVGNTQISSSLPGAIGTFSGLKNTNLDSIVGDLQQYAGNPIYGEINPLFTYYVRRHFAIGLLAADTKMDVTVQGRDLETNVDATVLSDSGLFVGFADELAPRLHVGATAKVVGRVGGTRDFSIVDFEQGTNLSFDPTQYGGWGVGFDVDLGAIYDLPSEYSIGNITRVGLTLNNLLASDLSIVHEGQQPPTLPRMLTLSAMTVFPGYGVIDNVNVLLDFAEFGLGGESDPDLGAREGSFWKHVDLGVELPMNWFALRLGIHQGDYTAGFGINAGAMAIDFATYAEELDSGVGRLTSRRYAAQIRLGLGAPPAPPLRDGETVPHDVPAAKPVETTTAPEKPATPTTAPVTTPAPAREKDSLPEAAPGQAPQGAAPAGTGVTPAPAPAPVGQPAPATSPTTPPDGNASPGNGNAPVREKDSLPEQGGQPPAASVPPATPTGIATPPAVQPAPAGTTTPTTPATTPTATPAEESKKP